MSDRDWEREAVLIEGVRETGGSDRPQDLKERTFEFSLALVRLCRTLDGRPGVSRTLGRQLLRSGTSIGANVEEAHSGQSRADFANKLSIALKEARETKYWLRLLDASTEDVRSLRDLISEADQLARILAAIIVKVKGKD